MTVENLYKWGGVIGKSPIKLSIFQPAMFDSRRVPEFAVENWDVIME